MLVDKLGNKHLNIISYSCILTMFCAKCISTGYPIEYYRKQEQIPSESYGSKRKTNACLKDMLRE